MTVSPARKPWPMSPRFANFVLCALLAACGTEPVAQTDAGQDIAEEVDSQDVEEVVVIPTFDLSLTASTTSGNVPLPVQFTLTLDTDTPATEFFYSWDFGDGDTREVNPDDEPELVGGMTHTFKYKGTFPTRVTVTWRKNFNVKKTVTQEIEVRQPAALSLSTIAVTGATEVKVGDKISLTFSILNEGAAITTPFETQILLSQDDIVDANDVVAATIAHTDMASGLEGVSAISYPVAKPYEFNVPVGVPDGLWFVLVHVDPKAAVPELNRLDNLGYATSLLQIDSTLLEPADLTIGAPKLSQNKPVTPGDTASYTVEIKNVGKGEAKGFKFGVYLSKDQKLDLIPNQAVGGGDISKHDMLITDPANSTLPSLDEGKAFTVFRALSVPTLPNGTYFLLSKVDVDNVVFETNEDNNTAIGETTLTVKKTVKEGVDVGLLAMVVKPKASYLGGNIGVNWHVKNLGTMQSPKFPATIYFCPTSTLSKSLCVINQTKFELPPLAVGEEKLDVTSISINVGTPLQNWYLFMLIDPENTVAELDEGNNLQKWDNPPLKVTASAQVEIKPENLGFHPASVVAGGEIKVSHKVVNTGNTGSGATETWYVLSTVPEISLLNTTNGKAAIVKKVNDSGVDGLDVGQRAETIVVPEGLDHKVTAYYVGVILDATAKEKTDSKGNNAIGSATALQVSGAKGGCYEDEHDNDKTNNDKAESAVALAVGNHNKLGSCANDDWWAITLAKGDSLVVKVLSSEILSTSPIAADLDVDLVAPDGTVIDSKKGLGLAKQAVALSVQKSGTYKIRVYPHAAGVQAQYQLVLQVDPPPAGIDLFGSTLVASPSATYPGGLIKARLDLTNLGATAAGKFSIRYVLSSDAVIDAADTKLKEVSYPSLGATETLETLETIVLPNIPGGKYYLGALIDVGEQVLESNEKNNAIASNSINLNTQFSCATDAFTGNHTVGDAAPIESKSAVYEKLNVCPGLEDWFKIELPKGKAFSAKVNWTPKPQAGLIGLQVLDASGQGVVAGTANPYSPVASIPYLQVGGVYYLHTYVLPVGGKPAEPYDYGLDLQITDPNPADVCLADAYESNNSAEQAFELGCGVAKMTLCVGDEDWFYLDLVKDEAVKVVLTHAGSGLEFSIHDNPKTAALQKISGSGTVDFKAPADGKYWMRTASKVAGAKPTGTFAYELKVDGGKGVDLRPTIKSMFPKDVIQGEDAYLSTELVNECKDEASAFHYAWYFSTNDKLDSDDAKVFEQALPGLGAKKSMAVDDKVPVPVEAKPGPAWLFIKIDSQNQVAESQEVNNVDHISMQVVKLCLGDALEPNNTPTLAKALDIGTVQDLSICPFELDWYVIEAEAGETLTLTATFDQALGDLDLRLYEPGKFGAALAVAATKKVPEQIVYKAAKAGKYYLRIGGFAGDSNAYSLSLCKSMAGKCLECPSDLYCPNGQNCLEGGICKALGCTPGDNSTCDDANHCTLDVCKVGVGCVKSPVIAGQPCEDGDACTLGETCDGASTCVAAKATALTTDAGVLGSRAGDLLVVGPWNRIEVGSQPSGSARGGFVRRRDGLQLAFDVTVTALGYPDVHLAATATATEGGVLAAAGWGAASQLPKPTLPWMPQGTTALFVALDGAKGTITAQRVFAEESGFSALHDLVAQGKGFVGAGGAKAASGNDGQDAWLVGLDAGGKTIWQAKVGGSGDDMLFAVQAVPSGGYLGVGADADADTWRALAVRTVPGGAVGWQKAWPSTGKAALFLDVIIDGAGAAHAVGGSDGGATQAGLVGLQPFAVGLGVPDPATAPSDVKAVSFPIASGAGRGWIESISLIPGGFLGGGASTVADAAVGLQGQIWQYDATWKQLGASAFGAKGGGDDALHVVGRWYHRTYAFGTSFASTTQPQTLAISVVPTLPSCDDKNACTVDACDAKTGCSQTPVANGTACGTGAGTCADGICK